MNMPVLASKTLTDNFHANDILWQLKEKWKQFEELLQAC